MCVCMSVCARLCACVIVFEFDCMAVHICEAICVCSLYVRFEFCVYVHMYMFYRCEKWVCEMCLVLSYNVLITGSIGVLESFGEKNMSISRPWKVFIFQNQETVLVSLGIFKFVQKK